MNISLVICSKGRAAQLQSCFAHLDIGGIEKQGGEVVLVYTAGDEATAAAMRAFADAAPVRVTVVRADRKGLAAARNEGVRTAGGKLLSFIDDDCHMHAGFIGNLAAGMADENLAYGSGKVIHIYGGEHRNDSHCPERRVLPPRTFLPTGQIQGSNMFFRRAVFDRIGLFREDMGAGSGTLLSCEDAEMVARAALAGYTGVMLPDVVVDHHQPKPWTPELNAKHEGYEYGRGTYYALLLTEGIAGAWDLWGQDWSKKLGQPLERRDLERLAREFSGAAAFVEDCLKRKN